MPTSSPALVVVSRGDQELGSWPESEVRRGLAEGRLQDSDYFWREGQTEWLPLAQFAHEKVIARPIAFAVRFGSARAVDQFGFVRKGQLTCLADTIEFRGMRHWPRVARFGLGLVAWILLVAAFHALANGDPSEAGGPVNSLRFYIDMVALLGAPCLAMMLTHYLCASSGTLSLAKSQITGVVRRGAQISFSAVAPGTNKPVKGLFRAENEAARAAIEKHLLSV